MKNILLLGVLFFVGDAFAAQTQFGRAIEDNFSDAPYLVDAADAWSSVLGVNGVGGAVYSSLDGVYGDNVADFRNLMAIIAYNDTALVQYQTLMNVDVIGNVVKTPLVARRNRCVGNGRWCNLGQQTMNVNVGGVVKYSTVDKHKNNVDFKARNTGARIDVSGYLNDGLQVGVVYLNAETNTRKTPVNIDAKTNGLMLYSKYLSQSGAFVNVGVNGGQINWAADKVIAGIQNVSDYDTDYVAGMINMGVKAEYDSIFVVPQFGVDYVRMMSEKHIDAAAQEFQKWWYNTLTGRFNLKMGLSWMADWFVVRPNINMGVGYDFISHGSDAIGVRVLSGQSYFVPVNTPNRLSVIGGAGVGVYAEWLGIELDYELDWRSDYVAHTGRLNLRLTF